MPLGGPLAVRQLGRVEVARWCRLLADDLGDDGCGVHLAPVHVASLTCGRS